MDKPTNEEAELRLSEQLCFRFYTASRLIQKAYQPFLEPLGITYPQYLVLLCLWEQDAVTVSSLVDRLGLGTNTLTPLLKRLEEAGLLHRSRGKEDSRCTILTLSERGQALRQQARCIPGLLKERLQGASYEPSTPLPLQTHLDELLDLFDHAH